MSLAWQTWKGTDLDFDCPIVGISGQAGAGKDEVAQHLVKEHGFAQIAIADPMKRLAQLVFLFSDEQLWGPSENRNKVEYRFLDDEVWKITEQDLKTYGYNWLDQVMEGKTSREFHRAWLRLKDWFWSLDRPLLSPRLVLQTLGTEYGRDFLGADVWVEHTMSTAHRLLSYPASLPVFYDRKYGVLPGAGEQERPRGVVISDVRFANELNAIPRHGGLLIKINRPQEVPELAAGLFNHRSETEQEAFDASAFSAIVNNDGSLKDLYASVDVVVDTFMEDAK
jgi:hypothetical protein